VGGAGGATTSTTHAGGATTSTSTSSSSTSTSTAAGCDCITGTLCDPETKTCVDAAYARVVTAASGSACAYGPTGALVWEQALTGQPSGSNYAAVPAKVLAFHRRAEPTCPPAIQSPFDTGLQATLAAKRHYTFVEAAGTRDLVDDGEADGPVTDRVRYVHGMPQPTSSTFDVSPTSPTGSPVRFFSAGLFVPATVKDPSGYLEIPPGNELSSKVPAVLTAPEVHYQLVPAIAKLGGRMTAYALGAASAPRVVVCRDGAPDAQCHTLIAAEPANGGCFAKAGQPAPSACSQCGVRTQNARYSCAGGPDGLPEDLVKDEACACAKGEATWYRCAGDFTSCTEYCDKVGRQCPGDSCAPPALCAVPSTARYELELDKNGGVSSCPSTGGCGSSIVSGCSGYTSTFCCCM
jgi:hypothetical protein